jgi:hypothetical protein
MRSSLVVRASDCQCTSFNGPGFDPSIRCLARVNIKYSTTLHTLRCLLLHFNYFLLHPCSHGRNKSDPDPLVRDTDPRYPDPHQNVTDPQH